MENNNVIENTLNKKTKLIVGIVFILIAVLIEGYFTYEYLNDKKSVKPIEEVIYEEDKYAYIDIQGLTDSFAVLETDNGNYDFYFALDKKYNYIVELTAKDIKKLKANIDYLYEGTEAEPVRIYGKTKKISSDLKKLAISTHNEWFQENDINTETFEDYLGTMYLDSSLTPKSDYLVTYVFSGIIALIGIITILVYFNNKKKMNKIMETRLSDVEKLKTELNNPNTKFYKKANIYLTDNYILSLTRGFELYNYNEILWVYGHDQYTNGVLTSKSIYILCNDTVLHNVANIAMNKKNAISYDEIFQNITMRCPKAKVGYTPENIELFKNMKK